MTSIVFGEWVPIDQAYNFLTERVMLKNPRFILDNWDCKYISIRVDMRTGMALVNPGNLLDDDKPNFEDKTVKIYNK